MSRRWLVWVAALAAGCAGVPERPPVADVQQAWELRRQTLEGLERWEVKGRVGMREDGRHGQANLVWDREGDHHRINLFGPFGGGRVLLVQGPEGARLRDAKRNTYTADNARELLYNRTGWDIPFDDLQYWVAGLPAPGGGGRIDLDAWGRLQALEQSGWRIRFLEYGGAGMYELPRKLVLTRGAENGDGAVEVRLFIQQWGLER